MPQGFCPALLVDINAVANGNTPGKKMQIAGFLAALFCCQNSSVSVLQDQFDQNTLRPMTVRYSPRPTLNDVSFTDTCDVDRIPGYNEWTINAPGFVSSSFFMPDSQMNQYCIDAQAQQSIGDPRTQVMAEIYDRIVETANLLLLAIDQDLVTQMGTKFGENVTTHHPSGKIININQDATKIILDNGVIDMMRDIQENEICGTPCLVGGGLFAAYKISEAIGCCNSAGLDMSKLAVPPLFYDKQTQSIWGPNTVGLFAPGSVKFIGRNAYSGAGAGAKGASIFTTFLLPVQEFGCNLDSCLGDLKFDLQLKYEDCPTNVVVDGVNTSPGRGWRVLISKRYAMWVQPTNAYSSADALARTNGTLKYIVTNNPGVDALPYSYFYTATT